MNIDRSAFDLRRELGIMTDDPAIVGAAEAGVRQLTGNCRTSTSAPDPLNSPHHHEDDFPHDHDLIHE